MDQPKQSWTDLYKKEDWWAIWFASAIIIFALAGVSIGRPAQVPKVKGTWRTNPIVLEKKSVDDTGAEKIDRKHLIKDLGIPLAVLFLGLGLLTTAGVAFMQAGEKERRWSQYAFGFLIIFIIAVIACLCSAQVMMKAYGIGYAVWALFLGLLISNTVGVPKWLLAGARSEMFIKTGLVLLGAEILFSKILKLGAPGLIVAWMVTPTVITFMWLFGTRILKMTSKPLVIIIAAATSVCGVSAAIAVAAASRAKKEELTLAVGMTMIFTVLMMIFMPPLSKFIGLEPAVGGAWLGGTIDATGAVVAAGALLGDDAEKVAAVVKMIQNVLIGIVAFIVAVVWTTRVDRVSDEKPSVMEIWYRFPKFILGFLMASMIFSFVLMPIMGLEGVDGVLRITKTFRGWFFCLAFVSIGLESNFKELASKMESGKPMVLYVVGQSFNIILTLFAAWLAFGGVLFKTDL